MWRPKHHKINRYILCRIFLLSSWFPNTSRNYGVTSQDDFSSTFRVWCTTLLLLKSLLEKPNRLKIQWLFINLYLSNPSSDLIDTHYIPKSWGNSQAKICFTSFYFWYSYSCSFNSEGRFTTYFKRLVLENELSCHLILVNTFQIFQNILITVKVT